MVSATTIGRNIAYVFLALSLSAASTTALPLSGEAAVVPLRTRSGSPLTQAAAEALLKPAGITASSRGGCTDKTKTSCTSYDGILSGTVDKLIAFKKASGVSSLVVTGGTEAGHAAGPFSHSKGFKVDLRHSPALDSFIKKSFTKIANRGSFPQWKDSNGDIYCDETTLNHWDVTFF